MESSNGGESNNAKSALPFLVTQWLSEFSSNANDTGSNRDEETRQKEEILMRIRTATSELAAAFSDLGAFGVALSTPIGESKVDDSQEIQGISLKHATFSDLSRRYGDNSNKLESLVTSSIEATKAVMNNANRGHSSIVEKISEQQNYLNNGNHRDGDENIRCEKGVYIPFPMHQPVLLESSKDKNDNSIIDVNEEEEISEVPISRKVELVLSSDRRKIEYVASQASKRYLTIFAKFQQEEATCRRLSKSMAYQHRMQKKLDSKINDLLSSSCASSITEINDNTEQRSKSDNLTQEKLENERVIAQLKRKLESINQSHISTSKELSMAKNVLATVWDQCKITKKSFADPINSTTRGFHSNWDVHGCKTDSLINRVVGREYGFDMSRRRNFLRRKKVSFHSIDAPMESSKNLFFDRLSHVVTINSHLYCPVYCLKFDRTGRYFITGADDCLVKVFRIGTLMKPNSAHQQRYHSMNKEFSSRRGAILVCTLRGHAGVITDIDVSFDNSLLATASEDGDVRVWSMSDGCPVAILRGHEEGANMVSWSQLTPFELTTIAGDGLARVWDIRKAALKRCKQIRSRRDYSSKLHSNNRIEETNSEHGLNMNGNQASLSSTNVISDEERRANMEQNNGIFVPPLPAGAEFGIGADVNNASSSGTFVANSEIDEGVTLLSRLQHGDLPDDQMQGAGTRARRKKVKVICLARCPLGGHFATGSDDGIGRIWYDGANDVIETLDKQNKSEKGCHIEDSTISTSIQRTRSSSRGVSNAPTTAPLLAQLHGHHNEITDIKYSHQGDRLLTASQQDGVVRIWSWGSDGNGVDGTQKFDQIRQVFIRMEAPSYIRRNINGNNQIASGNRRRGGNTTPSCITCCDVANWASDDSKVITSQTCIAKAGDINIIEGSHVIYIWDSRTGECLLGLPQAHQGPCPVLFTHPSDSSILVSAAYDGHAKVWDIEGGKCLFDHHNVHNHGALENLSDKGKSCRYIDGLFSNDGLHLVLTDDTGRITIFDSIESKDALKDDENRAPTFMQEQYFANDYYDLYYDVSGYCIERGSRLPPHLAPEAARCMHTGHPYADQIQLAFSNLEGPMPLDETEVCRLRDKIREMTGKMRCADGILSKNVFGKRHLIEARCRESSHIGISVNSGINRESTVTENTSSASSSNRPTPQRSRNNGRNMSSNYRWIGYDEMDRDDDDDHQDSDDEEYEEGNTLRRGVRDEEENMSEDEIIDGDDYQPRNNRGGRRNNNNSSRSRRRQNRNNSRRRAQREEVIPVEPTRTSSRNTTRRQDNQYVDLSDAEFDEVLSANTQPTGEFIEDYNIYGHIYKLPSNADVNRKWLSRINSVLGYTGWKSFCPQVGDNVVYIPRAHAEFLKQYPVCETDSGAPWKTFPSNASWSVVECKVSSIRYRFPYSGYFGPKSSNRIMSVIAILTLEVTGVPQINYQENRIVPWLAPDFVPKPSTRSNDKKFEVALFESGEADFIIPSALYKWKVRCLENIIGEDGTCSGIELTDYYVSKTGLEDSKFDPFPCQLVTTISGNEREFHFRGSGYNALQVEFEGNDPCFANTWDVTVKGTESDCPLPTCLTDEQEKIVFSVLDLIESDEYLKGNFSLPVDSRYFADYDQMIEVKMDLSMIRRRLEQKYYTNIESVLSDAKLIRDNCFKYNKLGSDITNEAQKLFDMFKDSLDEKLLSVDRDPCSRDESKEFNVALRSIALRSSSRLRQQDTLVDLGESLVDNSDLNTREDRRTTRNSRSSRAASLRNEVPRIRINMRRASRQQDEYISEEEDDEDDDDSSVDDMSIVSSENEGDNSTFDMSTTNLKVIIGGAQYTESSSSESETTEINNDSSNLRRSTRVKRSSYAEPDYESSDFSDEEKDEVISVQKKSSRNTERRNDMKQPSTIGTRRSTRTSGAIAKESKQDHENFQIDLQSESDQSEDENSLDESDASSTHQVETTTGLRRSSRTRGAKVKIGENEEEPCPEPEYTGRRSRTTRSSLRSTNIDHNARRESSRIARTETPAVESLQATFNRRRRASPRQSRHFMTDNTRSEVNNTSGLNRRTRGNRSTLENLPSSSPPSPSRSSPRRQRCISNYHDLSDSEVDMIANEEDHVQDTDFPALPRLKRKCSSTSRQGQSPARKKSKKKNTNVKIVDYPQLEKWPGHAVKEDMLDKVCEEIVNRVGIYDAEGIFHRPVIDTMPELAERYLKKIEHPMDLQTIRDKISSYRVISELQEDLIIMFKNCYDFNTKKSGFKDYAIEIWGTLDTIFVETLQELGITLPRGFA